MWTDAHCHLDPNSFDGDDGVDAAIARAREAGVARMVTIGAGYGLACAPRARDVASRHDDVWFSAGVHPHDAKHWGPEAIAMIEQLATHPKCVAVGEMGLDFHYDLSDRDVQRACLREQVALARRLGKPIIIHDRDSDGETLRILDETGAFEVGVQYHCFAGDVAHMREIVARGGIISIPGIVTFKKPGALVDVAREVPEDSFLVETDSPFLSPMPRRGRRNEPAHVRHTGAKVAEIRGLSPEDLAVLTSRNAARFYGLPMPDAVS